jgi:hypothetical protein
MHGYVRLRSLAMPSFYLIVTTLLLLSLVLLGAASIHPNTVVAVPTMMQDRPISGLDGMQ